jgi:Xaa-Pro aminopeptidase
VVAQREVKSAEEISELDRAVDISVEMHLAGMRCARPGMRESEVAARVAEVAIAANGNPSFPIIATTNGQTLHNHYHGNLIKSGDLFLLDAGAESENHYAGDLSSTFPVDPTFTPIQKDIYRLSLDAHTAAVSMLRPGTAFKEVHLTACRTIFEGLKAFGLTKGDTEEAVAEGAHALFFPCGTGHMMGLDVHDMENLGEQWVGYDGAKKSTQFGLKSLRLGKALRPGFVLTIEPGIYFIPDLIDLWKSERQHEQFLNYSEIEKFRNFSGLRNEEDFLITAEGARRLGKALPLTIEAVEAVRAI